ncbi:MAG: uL22 family ribosomal protein [Candidatus Pacearchaeota archaeon]
MVEEKQTEKNKEESLKKENIVETKKEENKENEKGKEREKIKEAIVNGKDLSASKKHCMAICDYIRGKRISDAIKELEQVIKLKRVIPMKGEIPHRKNIGPGRYPVNASKIMIKMLKSLEGNARVLNIENPIIKIAKADKASRPYRRFGSRRFKRTNVLLVASESKKLVKKI